MNITEEAIVSIASSLKSISESLEMIAYNAKKTMQESKSKKVSSRPQILAESAKLIKQKKTPKEAIDEIMRKEIF